MPTVCKTLTKNSKELITKFKLSRVVAKVFQSHAADSGMMGGN